MADIKWTWNFDVYDESDSPTEEGYYRIIDDEGNEMTDYYFNEPKMTPHGVGYWRDGTRPIIAWRFLGKTENSSEIPNIWDEFFREPTAEERKAVADYIDSISVPTGVNIFDLMDEPQTGQPCDGCEYSKPYIEYKCTHHSCKFEDEPQTTSTPYKVDTSSICKIEPQTERSE